MKPSWLMCHACRRMGTWWELNTLGCNHGQGCVLDASTAEPPSPAANEPAPRTAIYPPSIRPTKGDS